MTTSPSVSPKSTGALPEERFWKRYSPHGELPLSGAGSFAFHALVFGALLLWAVYLAAYFARPSRALPVEGVQLPGGGTPTGAAGEQGGCHGPEVGLRNEDGQAGDRSEPQRPELALPERQPPARQFKDGDRTLSLPPGAMKSFDRLNAAVRSRLNDGPGPARGRGGPGAGGEGPGGPGTGRAAPTKQVERMLRWSMKFDTRTGEDYVRQLRGLGAVLAVPVHKEGQQPHYKLIRDLSRRPAKLLDEDLSTIRSIYWIDDKPRSVEEVMNVLQLKLRPPHFVAFMPDQLEKELLRLEKSYRGLEEDQIEETKFRIVEKGGRFEPRVIEQTPRRR
jgi:hypothetical protein